MSDMAKFTCTGCKLSTWSGFDLSGKLHLECPQGGGYWQRSSYLFEVSTNPIVQTFLKGQMDAGGTIHALEQENAVYLAMLGQVHAAISFKSEEDAKASPYGLPADLAHRIYLALTQGIFPADYPASGGLVELFAAVENILRYREMIVAMSLPHGHLLTAELAGALHDLAMALKNVQLGSAPKPPGSENP